jgi:D-glycero-D-manno-heptose 1,7-bisphosphate phosphatase
MIKLIALDRDGVINEDSPNYIRSPEEWIPIPSSLEAIVQLTAGGYPVVVVTNQSGVGRKYFSLDTLEAIHEKMLRAVRAAGGEIAYIFYCPHTPEDDCDCRKPKPGLLLQAAASFNILPSDILMIGDAFRDILAAKNCGAQAIFLNNSGKTEDLALATAAAVPICSSLHEAVLLLKTQHLLQ